MILTAERRSLFHPLDTAGAPEQAVARLAALGITTVEELRDHWAYGDRMLLTQYLGESPLGFFADGPGDSLAARGARRGGGRTTGGNADLMNLSRVPPLVRHARGVPLSATEAAAVAEAPEARPQAIARAARTLPGVSLLSRFPAVRDQGKRGTCVAFAAVVYLEFHLRPAGAASGQRLAEQFVYWACKARDGIPTVEGTYVRTAATVLDQVGACLGKTWPYVPEPVGGNEGQGPPPAGAETEARNHRWSRVTALSAHTPSRLRETLDAGRPVVLSVKTFPSWDYPATADTGEVLMPIPGERSDGGHAVCLIGYELDASQAGGGVLLFRNSWGRTWAKKDSRVQPGYGTLFFEYVAKYGLEAFA